MILVDSSIWMDHFRRRDRRLKILIENRLACVHPFVIAEISMGNMRHRASVLRSLERMPELPSVRQEEFLVFVESRKLYGTGLSVIDAHLLASCVVFPGHTLWTRDKKMLKFGRDLGIAHEAAELIQ